MTASPPDPVLTCPGAARGFAEVAVDGAGPQARTYTYAVPPGMAVQPGQLVWAPFGPRTVQGIVFAVTATPGVEETRDIERVADPRPLLSKERIALARWLAGYYRVGLFLAASQMLPPGFASRLRTIVDTGSAPPPAPGDANRLGQRARRALALVAEDGPMRRATLARRLGHGGERVVDYLVRHRLLATRTEWQRPRLRPRRVRVLVLAVTAARALDEARRLEARPAGRGERQAALLRRVAAAGQPLVQAALARSFGRHAVDRLKALGLLRVEEVRVDRDPLAGYRFGTAAPLDPTPAQAAAIKAVNDALDLDRASPPGRAAGPGPNPADRRRRFLAFGVTGSGKTEVYLRAADHALRQGRTVLVLVPEIALTPQTLARFGSRFPGKVALLHSGLSDGERFDQWWRVANGDLPLVLGSRGAVFAPLDNLGLIVIDEEHEWTYKQRDPAPRYHARSVAERLAAEHGAVVLAGSATPDVETFRRAVRGEYRLLRLPARIPAAGRRPSRARGTGSAGLAGVRIVDMRRELRAGHTGMFSRALEQGMDEAVRSGGRIILFLNRRGAAAFVQCRRCGAVRACRRCDTPLTFHRADEPGESDSLICHHCGYRIRPPRSCRACGEPDLQPLGIGTQAVEDEVNRLFPGVGVLRWDRDTARTARAHERLLRRFLHGDARVLVGTQMVAKGLDIPEVTLVGVVLADTGLAIPDFRAGERAFQVLTQVAGRVGRGPGGGIAIIQTFQPEHYAVQAAADQDFERFYDVEIRLRAQHALPPFTRLIRLGYAHYEPAEALAEANRLADLLEHERAVSGETGTEVIGPSPSFPFRLRGLTRWHVLLKGARPERLLDRVPAGRDWTVDVDPVSAS